MDWNLSWPSSEGFSHGEFAGQGVPKALNTCLGSQVVADEDGAEMSPGIREQILGSKS